MYYVVLYRQSLPSSALNKGIRHRTFLVVQWLRLCAFNAGVLGSIPGQGTRSHMEQLKIPLATTKTHSVQQNKLKNAFKNKHQKI